MAIIERNNGINNVNKAWERGFALEGPVIAKACLRNDFGTYTQWYMPTTIGLERMDSQAYLVACESSTDLLSGKFQSMLGVSKQEQRGSKKCGWLQKLGLQEQWGGNISWFLAFPVLERQESTATRYWYYKSGSTLLYTKRDCITVSRLTAPKMRFLFQRKTRWVTGPYEYRSTEPAWLRAVDSKGTNRKCSHLFRTAMAH